MSIKDTMTIMIWYYFVGPFVQNRSSFQNTTGQRYENRIDTTAVIFTCESPAKNSLAPEWFCKCNFQTLFFLNEIWSTSREISPRWMR